MEGVHAEDDLFQRPARDEANEEGVVLLQRLTINFEPGMCGEASYQMRDVKKGSYDGALSQCLLQGLCVPAPPMSDDADPSTSLRA
jgi:hypothetical protein